MCRALLDCLAISLGGWTCPRPRPPPLLVPMLAMDAAASPMCPGRWQVGGFSHLTGMRVDLAPEWATNQQLGELAAALYGIRLMLRLGCPHFHLLLDNRAICHIILSLRPRALHPVFPKVVRHVFNLLWETRATVFVSWVPSALQPGDYPSRVDLRLEGAAELALARASSSWNFLTSHLGHLRYMGAVSL